MTKFSGKWISNVYSEIISSGTCEITLNNYKEGIVDLLTDVRSLPCCPLEESDMTFTFTGIYNHGISLKCRLRIEGTTVTTLSCTDGADLTVTIDKVEDNIIQGQYKYSFPPDTGSFTMTPVLV